jgi:uncharacterized protein YecT (DUF1311 family)
MTGLMVTAPARADDKPDARDVAQIRSCLKREGPSNRTQERCIETIYKRCIGRDEDAKSPSEQMGCLRREQLVWDQILNDSFQAMQRRLDDDQRIKLRDMQRAWIGMRDTTCGFFYDFYQGTMANPMIATCENRETARRAMFLLGFADEIATWPKKEP